MAHLMDDPLIDRDEGDGGWVESVVLVEKEARERERSCKPQDRRISRVWGNKLVVQTETAKLIDCTVEESNVSRSLCGGYSLCLGEVCYGKGACEAGCSV
jgi:hypothetical protein